VVGWLQKEYLVVTHGVEVVLILYQKVKSNLKGYCRKNDSATSCLKEKAL
jgi:hypothetical protein